MSEGDEAVGPVPALPHKLSVGHQPEQHHLRGISTSVHSSPPDSPMHLQEVRSLQEVCLLQAVHPLHKGSSATQWSHTVNLAT